MWRVCTRTRENGSFCAKVASEWHAAAGMTTNVELHELNMHHYGVFF